MSIHDFPCRAGTARIELPVSDILAALIAACAERRGMSVSHWVRRVIEKEIAADQLAGDRDARAAAGGGGLVDRYGYRGLPSDFFEKEGRP